MQNQENIKHKIKQIPELPGIYKMLDFAGNVIYVGKSKCLKKRVQSYFTGSPAWEKVSRMVTMIRDIEYIVTDTHLEARLLECKLIKEIKPRFNAQMKNDQRYIFLKVEPYNPYNPLSVALERSEDCFGPFRSKFKISEFLSSMKNIYPLALVNDSYEFEYHMFPVSLDRETFAQNRSLLLELFTDEDRIISFMEAMNKKLQEAASEYRYEIASSYRDMIHSLAVIKNGLDGYKSLSVRDILLKLPIPGGYKLFYVSCGYIINSRISPALSETAIEEFLRDSKAKLSEISSLAGNEKSGIDYRDILYSEISGLPDDLIELY